MTEKPARPRSTILPLRDTIVRVDNAGMIFRRKCYSLRDEFVSTKVGGLLGACANSFAKHSYSFCT